MAGSVRGLVYFAKIIEVFGALALSSVATCLKVSKIKLI